MSSSNDFNMWLIRVEDGINFKESRFPSWGMKNNNKSKKGTLKKMKKGDWLVFITNQKNGGKAIGMAEFEEFNDMEEDILGLSTKTNKEQNWKGNEEHTLQIKYSNLYITEKQNIKVCIQCNNGILNYETYKHIINDDLINHYKNFKFYAEPKKF
jgi:hypothetical protein